ncbi:hypothetical protein CYFUS_003317 [Cystobacter fuscus]|uniref:Uncharacterized protein n=1 Tax=Cystobacter fuscus TaxID=43 RepID=A0A250J306_9BACT|nr:hypothetical protein CYFUS_003317 [Cystobacter fuscus]
MTRTSVFLMDAFSEIAVFTRAAEKLSLTRSGWECGSSI